MSDTDTEFRLYTARNEIDADFLSGMLESEGIDSIQGEVGLEGYFNISPILGSNILTGGIEVLVREVDKDRALVVLDDFLAGKGKGDSVE